MVVNPSVCTHTKHDHLSAIISELHLSKGSAPGSPGQESSGMAMGAAAQAPPVAAYPADTAAGGTGEKSATALQFHSPQNPPSLSSSQNFCSGCLAF
jgi:hypothetical protein